jgi:hypothetical protein
MTKPNFTSINVVLDRSGSMSPLQKDTIGGFNSFLNEQKLVPGEAVFTLALFDDQYELVHDCVPLASVPELTDKTYVPRGSTALLDAIGRTINATGAKLAAMNEEDRPDKVVFLIMTDGEENCSQEFAHSKIMEMIGHQRDKYSWQFLYIGAAENAIQAGRSMGFSAHNTYKYAASSAGTASTYGSISRGLTDARLGSTKNVQLDPADLLGQIMTPPTSSTASSSPSPTTKTGEVKKSVAGKKTCPSKKKSLRSLFPKKKSAKSSK